MPSLNEEWRKSTHSGTDGSCVEVRRLVAKIEMRDTKDRDGAVLSFSTDAWRHFVAAVHDGEFDRQ